MIFGKSRLELKVGIFVFVGLVILVTLVLLIGDFKTWTSGYKVNFIFNFTNGVKIGAPVRFAGVDVGEVKDIKFIFAPQENKTKVQIIGWIKKEIKVPLDSTIWVNTLGLLGEKYIEIMPGEDYKNFLNEGQVLTGNDPVAMHEVAELAKKIASDLDESIVKIKNKEGTIGKLLYDDAIYKELEALIIDIRKHPWKLFWKTKEKPEKK
jgi:phospholipid/cholesterol/gamma-HCH transport system substrate-binding protein